MPVILPGGIALLLATHGPLPSIPYLVEGLHAPRRGIVNYEVVIDAQQAKGTAIPLIERIWQDGPRYRVDRLDQFDGRGRCRRSIDCTNGPEPGLFFTVRYDAVFDRSRAASMFPLADRIEIVDRRFRFTDLGATPEEVLNQACARGLSWYLEQEEWTEKRVERARWQNLPAYRIVLAAPTHPTQTTIEVTLVPARGFSAVHARHVWTEQGKVTARTSESELARIAGTWLPKSSEYREHTAGKLTAELVQKIEYVSVNRPVEARVFTLAGMGLIPDTLVGTRDGLKVWDGARLVPAR